MKKSILLASTLLAFASCESYAPTQDLGRVLYWTIESGGTAIDTIAPTRLFNEATDIEDSYFNLNLDPSDDAVLDSTRTFFL